jgi:hypothetical protein
MSRNVGSSVLNSIRDQIRKIEQQDETVKESIFNCERGVTALAAEEESIYSRLAEIYLPDMTAQSIKDTLREVQSQIQNIYDDKQNKQLAIDKAMQESKKQKVDLTKSLEETTTALNLKVTQREDIKARMAKELDAIPEYKSMHETAEQSQSIMKRHKERIDEVSEQSRVKLAAYDGNRFFTYLVNRDFGTDRYTKSGIFAALDRWVASKIDFKKQKENYDFLRSLPELMKLEVQRAQEELNKVVEQLQDMETSVATKYGLQKLLTEGQSLLKERDQLMQGIADNDKQYATLEAQRKDADSTQGSFYRQAKDRLKDFLDSEDIQTLKEKARSTPGTDDDKLVDRLDQILKEIQASKIESKQYQKQLDGVEQKLTGLKDVESKYTSKDYDSTRSYFESDFDIDELLKAYVIGKLASDSLWSTIDNKQKFTPVERYRSSSSYDSYNSRSSYGSNSSYDTGRSSRSSESSRSSDDDDDNSGSDIAGAIIGGILGGLLSGGGSSSHHDSGGGGFGGFGGGSHSSGGSIGGGSHHTGGGF